MRAGFFCGKLRWEAIPPPPPPTKMKTEQVAPSCLKIKSAMAIVQQRGIVGKVPKLGMSRSVKDSPLDSATKAKVAAIRDEIEQAKLRRLANKTKKQNPFARVKIVGRFLEVQTKDDKGRWQAKVRM